MEIPEASDEMNSAIVMVMGSNICGVREKRLTDGALGPTHIYIYIYICLAIRKNIATSHERLKRPLGKVGQKAGASEVANWPCNRYGMALRARPRPW